MTTLATTALTTTALTTTESDGILAVTGDIDLLTAPELHDAMTTAARTTPGFVLDLSGVDFFSSAGVTVIETVAAAHPGAVRAVIAPSPRMRRTLEILGVTRLVPIV